MYFPLQSGSQSVLTRMNRHYDVDFVMKSLQRLKDSNQSVLIRTEFIIGYPGESWQEFLGTVRTCLNFPFDQIDVHVFSPRPGTEAAELEDQVAAITKITRYLMIATLVFFRTTLRKFRPI